MIRVCKLKIRQGRRTDQAKLEELLWRCRVLYNAALEQRIDAYRKQKRTLSFYEQCKELTALRDVDPVYTAMDVTMQRLTVMRRLDLAFKSFFRRCKTGEKPGFPRFKGRDRFDTLVFSVDDHGRPRGWKLSGHKLSVRGAGWFRVANLPHRDGKLVGLRLVHKAGRWWAHVLVDVGAAPAVKPSVAGVGIDVGIKTFATMSDGTTVEHPRFLRESLDELKDAQRDLSTKKRGSRRRADAKARLVRVHERVANRRRDFVHQTARRLVDKYDGLAVEDLDVAEMASTEKADGSRETGKQARGLRRGIMDSAWGMLLRVLAAKAEEAGLPLVRVNPKGTTQRCSQCGSLVRKTLRDRVHDCAACGLRMDRDLNAARNINDLGWRSAELLAAEDLSLA
jgi:putative transposase